MELTEEEQKLKKKYFPRVNWTENGPVRREYLVYTIDEKKSGAAKALAALAVEFGFCAAAVSGDAAFCREQFGRRADGADTGLIFGTEAAAIWCDAAVCPSDEPEWEYLIVRSEQAENLTALAHEEGVLRFRRIQG